MVIVVDIYELLISFYLRATGFFGRERKMHYVVSFAS